MAVSTSLIPRHPIVQINHTVIEIQSMAWCSTSYQSSNTTTHHLQECKSCTAMFSLLVFLITSSLFLALPISRASSFQMDSKLAAEESISPEDTRHKMNGLALGEPVKNAEPGMEMKPTGGSDLKEAFVSALGMANGERQTEVMAPEMVSGEPCQEIKVPEVADHEETEPVNHAQGCNGLDPEETQPVNHAQVCTELNPEETEPVNHGLFCTELNPEETEPVNHAQVGNGLDPEETENGTEIEPNVAELKEGNGVAYDHGEHCKELAPEECSGKLQISLTANGDGGEGADVANGSKVAAEGDILGEMVVVASLEDPEPAWGDVPDEPVAVPVPTRFPKRPRPPPENVDVDDVVQSMRNILMDLRNVDDARLNPDDDAKVRSLLEYHPNAEEKAGCGIDYIKIKRHSTFKDVRCFWAVRTDGSETDFSYHKCLKEKVAKEHPTFVDRYDAVYRAPKRPRQA